MMSALLHYDTWIWGPFLVVFLLFSHSTSHLAHFVVFLSSKHFGSKKHHQPPHISGIRGQALPASMASTSAQELELSSPLLDVSHSPERPFTLPTNLQRRENSQDVSVKVSRQGQCCRLSIFMLSVLLSVLACVWLLSVVISQWKEQSSYRMWLVLGLMSYFSVLIYKGWDILLQFGEETLLMQITIKSTRAGTLYNAVCEHVASIAAKTHGASVSRDMEAGLEYDATVGRSIVKLEYWGRRGKTVRMKIMSQALPASEKTIVVTQIRNAEILTGRNHQPTADDCLILRMWSNDSSLEHDSLLVQSWLQTCASEHLKQPKEQVQIYRPLQRWKEEAPEWTLYRTRCAPSASTTGPMSYIPRRSLSGILVDVTHRHTSLRVYFVHGATGTGKSHFVVWLASQLGMPIYNISLTSPMVRGDSLLRLFSETSLKHWPCLVHIDEFDATVSMWKSRSSNSQALPAYGVSLETFKELLDGSASMSSGIIIITGMADSLSSLPPAEEQQIRRRLHQTACIDSFTLPELQSYASKYISFFVDPAMDRNTSASLPVRFASAFVQRVHDQTVHGVKKELEAFLTKALHDSKMLPRRAPNAQHHSTANDRDWWESMCADMRDYVLPLQVLQEYVDHEALDSGNE